MDMDVRSSYDSAAEAYAEHLFRELEYKPLDRHLLNRFAEAVAGKGLVVDLGCGPGHVANYLSKRGVRVCGIDLSPGMVRVATRLCGGIEFQVGDMRHLEIADGSLAGIMAFYSIVHFTPRELAPVFREWRRVVASGAPILLSFHIGAKTVHVDDLWGSPVSLDFRFHEPTAVMTALSHAGLTVMETTERAPYPDVEYPSRRCYMFAVTDGE